MAIQPGTYNFVVQRRSDHSITLVFKDSNEITPSILANSLDSTAILEAVPPTWKVRIVSCVPGSPMDWAAITPMASP